MWGVAVGDHEGEPRPHWPRALWLNTVTSLAVGFERIFLIFMDGQHLTTNVQVRACDGLLAPYRSTSDMNIQVRACDGLLAPYRVYLYGAIDQYGQVIDVLVSEKRDLAATRRFFTRALEHGPDPAEVSTDWAPAYPRVVDELLPTACHIIEQYANNPIEADHSRWKARLRPMRGLKQLRSARVVSAGNAFIQNLRRGHYELGLHVHPRHRLPAAFTELILAI
jgi:transposase, IS6 family